MGLHWYGWTVTLPMTGSCSPVSLKKHLRSTPQALYKKSLESLHSW